MDTNRFTFRDKELEIVLSQARINEVSKSPKQYLSDQLNNIFKKLIRDCLNTYSLEEVNSNSRSQASKFREEMSLTLYEIILL